MRSVFLFFVMFVFYAYSANANEKSLNFRLGVIQSKTDTNFRKFNFTKNKTRIELENNKKYDFSKIIADLKFYNSESLFTS